MTITRILIPAAWEEGGQRSCKSAEFKLGLGPCGKTVTRLTYHLNEHFMFIYQVHSDGSSKDFAYPLGQLTGRIEVEHAA